MLEKFNPGFQRQARHPAVDEGNDAVGGQRVQAPGGVAGVHFGLGGQTQDHLLAFRIADHAFENAFEDENLFHVGRTLGHEHGALGVLDDFEFGLKLLPGGGAELAQCQILPKLGANADALGVRRDAGHGGAR